MLAYLAYQARRRRSEGSSGFEVVLHVAEMVRSESFVLEQKLNKGVRVLIRKDRGCKRWCDEIAEAKKARQRRGRRN
ncbi:unnamed protein product [Cochlearia groenlandica]